MSSSPVSRRDRIRAATTAEILESARQVLVRDGPDGLTLRAIARELGLTAPALYRYYPSREHLIDHVIAAFYDELVDRLERVSAAVASDDPLGQLLAVARAFRKWALAHPREFGLMFGSPIRGNEPRRDSTPVGTERGQVANPADLAGQRFAAVFATALAEVYRRQPFAVPADDDIDPALRKQLVRWRKGAPVQRPTGLMLVFLTGWVRIYGLVCMEVFDHLKFALSDGEPMYERELSTLADMLRTPPS
jgi:AcrR family transcriptional regulator